MRKKPKRSKGNRIRRTRFTGKKWRTMARERTVTRSVETNRENTIENPDVLKTIDEKEGHGEDNRYEGHKGEGDEEETGTSESSWSVTPPSRLTVLEAFGAACTLEKWVKRIQFLEFLAEQKNVGKIEEYDSGENRSLLSLNTENSAMSVNAEKVSESQYVANILEHTARELQWSCTFGVLQRENQMMVKKVHDKLELEDAIRLSRRALEDLKADKKKRKNEIYVETWRVDKETRRLAAEYDKTVELIAAEKEYLRTWDALCLDDNQKIFLKDIGDIRKQIETIDAQSRMEENCTVEARRMFAEYTERMDDLVLTWERTYANYVGPIDIEILTLEQEQEDLDDSCETLSKRADVLRNTVIEQEERKRERDERYEKYINDMATKIQALWRGTAVRRFIGRYKYLKKLFKRKSKKRYRSRKSKRK